VRAAFQQAGQKNGTNYTVDICSGLDQAVETAAKLVHPGDVVLLTPGGTSFDEFTDYEARGRRFKELVLSLPEKE
jgi:UDP-N-acetylmuramoylalanine--D-glutamate ligase